ncbi:MAG: DUF4402 domain-containing protein [Alphaproteobacteria bacterium]|nr:DUF4402 domain-containing protein [Alphaproteobacteria bacterium]
MTWRIFRYPAGRNGQFCACLTFAAALWFLAAGLAVSVAQNPFCNVDRCDFDATIFIKRAFEITLDRPLQFGNIVAGRRPSSVIIGADEQISKRGDAVLFRGRQSAARYTVTGEPGENFSVELPEGQVTLSTKNDDTMNLTDWTLRVLGPGGDTTIPPSGSIKLIVGATLEVDGNQALGNYTGTYSVSVAFD